MSEEIRVSVNRYGPRRNLVLRWVDPITGERKAKSAGTKDAKTAERLAGELEKELRAGRCQSPSRITWEEFRQRFTDEKLPSLADKSQNSFNAALNHVERVIHPKRLAALSAGVMSRFQAALRKERMRESTLATHLRHVKAALGWAAKIGMLDAVPAIEMPRRSKGKTSRGRPLKLEEAEKMFLVVPRVRPRDTAVWRHYLTGLWLSGLRLEESLALSWNEDAPFAVDFSGRRPRFRIAADAQKSGKDQLLPMAPDFAEFLRQTCEAERTGRVFRVNALNTGEPLTSTRVSRIGRKAGVVVNVDGKAASCHDFRRSFGTRWAMKVRPPVLQVLMRHANIDTTLTHYVSLDADDIGDELWKAHVPADSVGIGNISGNIGQNAPQKTEAGDAETLPETVEESGVTEGGGQETRTPNRFPNNG